MYLANVSLILNFVFQGQRFTVDIEADLENFDVLLPLVTRRLLDSVIVHSSLCDDSLCSVPWCLFFTQYW